MSTVPGPYVPSEGYQVPPTFGQNVPSFVPGAHDPLVPPPGSRFEGWWTLVIATLRRSFVPLVLIFLLTEALPTIALSVLGAAFGVVLELSPISISDGTGISWDSGLLAGSAVAMVLFLVVILFISALGWAAAIYAVIHGAAGERVSLRAAFGAGLRRVLPMWGWHFLSIVIFVIGLILCVLPGLYFGVALSLFSFAVVFERGRNPFSRSFQLVNNHFGAALGRVALVFGLYLVVSLVVSCVAGVVVSLLGTGAADALNASGGGAIGAGVVGEIVRGIIEQAVALPLLAFVLVGLMITYTQLRATEEPLSTLQLRAEA